VTEERTLSEIKTLLERYIDNPVDYLPPSGPEAGVGSSSNGEAGA
jgi:hypothetical protein